MTPDIARAWRDPQYRADVQQWIRDHGLNPEDVKLEPGFPIDEQGRMRFTRYLRDADGKLYAKHPGGDVATEPVFVTPLRPFPDPRKADLSAVAP